MKNLIHIVGVGSPFGDDRFGWAAAEALRHSGDMNCLPNGSVEISILDRPGPLLLAHWQDADCVILLDAVCSGAAPGTRHVLNVNDLVGRSVRSSSHGFGIVSTIELARAIGSMPAQLLLRGVEADSSWTGHTLSPAVADSLPSFVADIAQEALVLTDFYFRAAVNQE